MLHLSDICGSQLTAATFTFRMLTTAVWQEAQKPHPVPGIPGNVD